jgi:hypothetical protein
MKELLLNNGFTNVKTWSRGVDTSNLEGLVKSYPIGKTKVLYVGRISREKNLEKLLELQDYYDIIIVDNKDTNLKRIGCVYINLEKQKYLFPNIEVNNIYSYYQRKRNGHIYANSKGYNEIYVITDDIILIIFILIFILIIINFSIYDRK